MPAGVLPGSILTFSVQKTCSPCTDPLSGLPHAYPPGSDSASNSSRDRSDGHIAAPYTGCTCSLHSSSYSAASLNPESHGKPPCSISMSAKPPHYPCFFKTAGKKASFLSDSYWFFSFFVVYYTLDEKIICTYPHGAPFFPFYTRAAVVFLSVRRRTCGRLYSPKKPYLSRKTGHIPRQGAKRMRHNPAGVPCRFRAPHSIFRQFRSKEKQTWINTVSTEEPR